MMSSSYEEKGLLSTVAFLAVVTFVTLFYGVAEAQPDAGTAAPRASADAGAKGPGAEKEAQDPSVAKLRKVLGLMRGKKYEEAEAIISEVLDKDPAHELALLNLADIYVMTNREKKAVELFTKTIASDTSGPRIYIKLSSMYERLKDRKKSLEVLNDCVTRFPKDIKCYVRRGQYFGVGNMKKAASNYERALEIDPNNRTALNNLATIEMSNCRYKKASLLLENYHKLHPNSSSGAFNLGSTYYALGMTEKGIALHEELLKRKPNHVIALSGLALGHTLSGNPDKGIETLAPLSSAAKPSPPVSYNLGLAYLFKADAEKAEVELAKAVSAAPRRTHFVMALAEALRLLGKTDEAERILKKQKKISPSTAPYVSTYMAILHESKKEHAKARAELDNAKGLLSDYSEPKDLRFLMRVPPAGLALVEKIASAPVQNVETPDSGKKTKGGCGCSTAGPSGEGLAAALGLMLAAAFWTRRRSTFSRRGTTGAKENERRE